MSIKIGIDLRCLAEGKKTGVEVYASKMAEILTKKNPEKEIVIFINSFKKNRSSISWLKKYSNVKIKYLHYPNKLLNLSFWFLKWPKIDKILGGAQIIFMPNIAFGSFSRNCKLILSVHDLSFERFPGFFSIKKRFWHFLVNPRQWLKRADLIWSVSQSTKEDLISLYKIREDKIKVYNPSLEDLKYKQKNITANNRRKIIKKYNLPFKYILFLGTLEPRKNVISVIKAFEHLRKEEKYRNLKLVIVGNRGWLWENIIKYFLVSSVKDSIIFTGFVQERDKPVLYQSAEVFIYPSFLEGFGYPPLEAMAAGTPVITSNCSSFPETIQDSAILVDPYRPFEIAQGVKLLLENKKLRDFYIKKGRENIKRISSIKI